jgi:hypothetical protein
MKMIEIDKCAARAVYDVKKAFPTSSFFSPLAFGLSPLTHILFLYFSFAFVFFV